MPEVQKPILGQKEKRKELTAERLRNLLDYDPDTGVFIWLVARGQTVKIGDVAGCRNSRGYILMEVDRRQYRAHRLAWFYMTGCWPDDQIDHKNGIKDDNRWDNLREATNTTNGQNQRRPQKRNKSGFLGVTTRKAGWEARIWIDGRYKYLGVFATPDEAHVAYLVAKRESHEGCTI